jgi:hypothetical protein
MKLSANAFVGKRWTSALASWARDLNESKSVGTVYSDIAILNPPVYLDSNVPDYFQKGQNAVRARHGCCAGNLFAAF